MRMPRKIMLLTMCIILFVGGVDCSGFHPSSSLLPPPPSEKIRATLGTIGIISAGPVLSTEFDLPPQGAGQGALKGAKAGAEYGAIGGVILVIIPGAISLIIIPLLPFVAVGALAAAVAGGVLGGISGSIYGAITAAPSGSGEPAIVSLKEAMAKVKIEETLRDRVFQIAHAQTDNRVILLQDQRPADMDEDAYVHSFAEKGITTILTIRMASVNLKEEALGFNRPVKLTMTGWANLVNTKDNNLIGYANLDYYGSSHLLADWTANDAQRFRVECDVGLQSLAERIVDQLFLVYPLPPGG
jgi:hypothetical protein